MFAHHRRGLYILLLLLGAMVVGCGEGEGGVASLPVPKVTVGHPIVRELVDEDDYNGWMQASQTVDVRARVRGHIWKIYFQDGDMVKKDQLLFELDPRPFQAAVDQDQAQVEAVKAQRNVAEKDLARNAALVKSGAVTLQEYDESLAKVQSLAAEVVARMKQQAKDQLDRISRGLPRPLPGESAGRCSPRGTLSTREEAIRS